MDDIVPVLLEIIQEEFDSKISQSTKIKQLLKLLKDGEATYSTAYDFSVEVGKVLADILSNHITADSLPDSKMYYNIANRILTPTMEKNHNLISGYTEDVQRILNNQARIHLKPQVVPINKERIDGIINRVSSEDSFNDIAWILKEPIVIFSQSIVDDMIKANVEFHAKAGLRPKITRHLKGKACKWCRSLAGSYNYDEAPADVYRRHENCRCTVEYNPGSGRRQSVWSKQWKNPDKNDKIKKRKFIAKSIEKKEVYLQEQLDFIDVLTGEKSFIPKDVIIKEPKTIAQGKEIRIVKRLVDAYGGRMPNWKKRVGKIESSRYIHDVHWYENKSHQYEAKIKIRKEKPDENN